MDREALRDAAIAARVAQSDKAAFKKFVKEIS